MRVGIGYDVHRLSNGRKLVLGGVEIPYSKGLEGHSDADVLVHSLCDALLGAAALGDIGEHFPDTDPAFRDVYSIELLEHTMEMISDRGYAIVNIDAVIFAQSPKISPHKTPIIERLSATCRISADRVNLKATTTEGLGAIGRGEGIAAMCVVMLQEKENGRDKL